MREGTPLFSCLCTVDKSLWLRRDILGFIRSSPLPPYRPSYVPVMSQQYQIPGIPRVTSPTPPPSDSAEGSDGYFAPITQSKQGIKSPPTIDEEEPDEEESSESSLEKRARTRSRSPKKAGKVRRMSGLTAANSKSGPSASRAKKKPAPLIPNGIPTGNGHLSPSSAGTSYWREFSRSPSPLGLIPIHRHWRSFVSISYSQPPSPPHPPN